MKKVILVFSTILLIASLVYTIPRLKVISEFRTEYGKIEDYQNIGYGEPYIGRYAELIEEGMSIKLPVDGDNLEFIVTDFGDCKKCESQDYQISIILLDDGEISSYNAECDNTLLLNYELVNNFRINYLYINYEDMNFFQPTDKLEFYYERYGLKHALLEEYGSKYLISSTNKDHEVIAILNDNFPKRSNYNVLSLIVYEEDKGRFASTYALIQIKKNNEIFTEEEILSIAYSLEILNENN